MGAVIAAARRTLIGTAGRAQAALRVEELAAPVPLAPGLRVDELAAPVPWTPAGPWVEQPWAL
jgi:hypothetical protein